MTKTTKSFQVKVLVVGILAGLIAACASVAKHDGQRGPAATPALYHNRINQEAYYTDNAADRSDPVYQAFIKFSILLKSDGISLDEVYFQNSQYQFHADFLTLLPQFQGMTRSQIDQISLQARGRKVFLGTLLIRHPERGTLPSAPPPQLSEIELISQDPLPPEQVAEVFQLIRSRVEFPAIQDPYYQPVPEQRAYVESNLTSFEARGIRLAPSRNPGATVCYSSGWGIGRVKLLKAAEVPDLMASGLILPEDILVLDSAPRELPLLSGLVVGMPSAPSSHAALLSQMARSPFIFEVDAHKGQKWAELANAQVPVFFSAHGEPGGACVVEVHPLQGLTPTEMNELVELKRPKPLQVTQFGKDLTNPILLQDLLPRHRSDVGAKAANLAQIMKLIPNSSVSTGLALPIALYDEYLGKGIFKGKPIHAEIDPRLAKIQSSSSVPEILAELKAIQEAISKGTIPADLQKRIMDSVSSTFRQGTRIRLRSSSNVEDGIEFNGAGLYQSKGACVGDDGRQKTDPSVCRPNEKADPVLKSIQKVWASFYTPKAFLARRYYGIDESRIGMGILIHPGFNGELANGVALSRRSADYGREQDIDIISTGFPGEEESVTNPTGGKIPETTRIYPNRFEVLVRSTEVPVGRTVLSGDQYRELHQLIAKVHDFYRKSSGILPREALEDLELDFEWKLISENGQQKLILKQVRPVPQSSAGSRLAGRGSFVLPVQRQLFCPASEEISEGVKKLKFARPIQVSTVFQEVPTGDLTSFPNPIRQLDMFLGKTEGTRAMPTGNFSLRTDEWRQNEGLESRTLDFALDLDWEGIPAQLTWKLSQNRSVAPPQILRDPIFPFGALELEVRLKDVAYGDRLVTFKSMPAGSSCDLDAYQGSRPEEAKAYGRTPPTKVTKKFSGTLKLEMTGRTSLQGFDKTQLIHADELKIWGLLGRDWVINEPFKITYAPEHHNFNYQIAADLEAADGLTPQDLVKLRQQKIRYLVLEANLGSQDRNVYGVSEDGLQKTPFGTVREEGSPRRGGGGGIWGGGNNGGIPLPPGYRGRR